MSKSYYVFKIKDTDLFIAGYDSIEKEVNILDKKYFTSIQDVGIDMYCTADVEDSLFTMPPLSFKCKLDHIQDLLSAQVVFALINFQTTITVSELKP
jgi:hypothetical protein